MANNPVPFKGVNSYLPLSDTQSAQFLAQFLPKGKLFAKATDATSNLYKLIYCLSDFVKQITAQFYVLFYNRNFTQIVELLPEWETSVGIPSIFPRLSTTAARQTAIQTLVSKIPVINTMPYAVGTMTYNNSTGLVICTLSTARILTSAQTQVTVSLTTQAALSGTFLINYVSSQVFTFSISAGLGLLSDNGNFAFNYSFNANTTYEQFVYNLTGIKIHIYFNPFGITNNFPCSFPIVFGSSYNQSLLLFNVLIVGSILSNLQMTAFINAMNWVVPSFSAYQIVGYVSI